MHFPMKWHWTNWKSGNSTQSATRQWHKRLPPQIKVHPSVNISSVSRPPAYWLIPSSELCQMPQASTRWTGTEGDRTCWAGHRLHQPTEVSRWLNRSYSTVNEPEPSCLFITAWVGLRLPQELGPGQYFPSQLGTAPLGPIGLPSELAAMGKGPPVLVAACAETVWEQDGKEERI